LTDLCLRRICTHGSRTMDRRCHRKQRTVWRHRRGCKPYWPPASPANPAVSIMSRTYERTLNATLRTIGASTPTASSTRKRLPARLAATPPVLPPKPTPSPTRSSAGKYPRHQARQKPATKCRASYDARISTQRQHTKRPGRRHHQPLSDEKCEPSITAEPPTVPHKTAAVGIAREPHWRNENGFSS